MSLAEKKKNNGNALKYKEIYESIILLKGQKSNNIQVKTLGCL